MKWIKYAACLGLLIASVPRMAGAQVLKEIPSSAWFVLKVSNLDATSKKVADLAASLGIVQMAPEMSDPLGAFLKSFGAPEGVDRSGEIAVVYMDPAVSKAPNDKSVLFLMPVSDYDKFTANFPDAKPDGDLITCHFKNDPTPGFIGHWGNYAAMSPTREIVAAPPTDTMQVTGLPAKEFDGKDFVLYANMNGLRSAMQQHLADLRQNFAADIDKAVQNNPKMGSIDTAKFAPVAKVVGGQVLDLADRLAADTSAATISANLSPDGIAETVSAEFLPDSKMAGFVKEIKNTDDSMLEGIGDGKYLIFGGNIADPQSTSKNVADFLTPIEASISTLGPDYTPINDWLNSLEKVVGASTGGSFGWIAPTTALGQGALMQMVQVHRGDAKTTMDGMHEMFDAQIAAMKVLGVPTPANSSPKYIPAAKTVDGVAFDEVDTPVNAMGGQGGPQQQQIAQIMSMIYGPQGPAVLNGVVDDKDMLTVLGLDDAAISKAIAAVKAGDDPLAKLPGVKTVAGELPAQRFAAVYVPLDLWASTGLSYAKQFGMDMGVTLPDNLPPVGAVLSTDGSAVRDDVYIPTQLIQAVTSAGIQIYTKMQAPPPQNGAPPGGGGM